MRQFLDEELKQAFGTADKLVGQMQVRLVFKGVTYESLKDDKFLEAAEKVIPGLRQMIEEFDVAKAVSR